MTPPSAFISVKDTAGLLGVSKGTVYRRYHAGQFPGRRSAARSAFFACSSMTLSARSTGAAVMSKSSPLRGLMPGRVPEDAA